MTVDRISSVEPIQPGKKPEQTNRVRESRGADSINISSEAHSKAEALRVRELAMAAPDVRADRVSELKEKINDPAYIDEKIMNATADRLMNALFG